jgi:transposase InsO family protein
VHNIPRVYAPVSCAFARRCASAYCDPGSAPLPTPAALLHWSVRRMGVNAFLSGEDARLCCKNSWVCDERERLLPGDHAATSYSQKAKRRFPQEVADPPSSPVRLAFQLAIPHTADNVRTDGGGGQTHELEDNACLAGLTPHPDARWMMQIARNMMMADWGALQPGQYPIHDRDAKYCPAFEQIIDHAGVTPVLLPPRSPNLNAYAERWVRSVKEEMLSRLILFGEHALWHALIEYVTHFHEERPHQGKGNVILMPLLCYSAERQGPI